MLILYLIFVIKNKTPSAKKTVKLKNDVAYQYHLTDRVGTYGCIYLMEVNEILKL